MGEDYIDEVIGEWAEELPELYTDGLAIGGRIAVLERHLSHRIDRYLADLDLQIWGFDVLASLYRSGPPYSQTPSQLMRNCFLSSGAVTNRLKRLEARDLIFRQQDTVDRRSVAVILTDEGKKLAKKAIEGRIDFMKSTFDGLSKKEQKELVSLLRKLLIHVQDLEGWS
jgi:DNA-binding MarR family transcriptional regulator